MHDSFNFHGGGTEWSTLMSCLPIRWTKRSMSDSPGRVSGSKRLRADLARKVSKQTARAVDLFHAAGLVHGGSSYSGVQVVHSPDV